MNYSQPKLEKRDCVKCKLSLDGSRKEYRVDSDNIHNSPLGSEYYHNLINIISQDFFHFLKSKDIIDRKHRTKIVNCIKIFINYLIRHKEQAITSYRPGIIKYFLTHWYSNNYPNVPASFIDEMKSFILYYYEYLLSLNWINKATYSNIKSELNTMENIR